MSALHTIRNLFHAATGTLDPSKWRTKGRISAYVEVTLSLVWISVALFYWHKGVTHTMDALLSGLHDESDQTFRNLTKEDELLIKDEIQRDTTKLLVLGVVVIGAVAAIDIWSAVWLFKATAVGADPKVARERTRNWRYVQIVLFVASGLITWFTESYIILTGKLLCRALLVFVVSKFISELETNIQASKAPGNDLVVVTTAT